ncbi:hypothetical protein [Methylophaga nitratireducenticrescens]|uniref:Uncharacterized protein n=1 Tax=Methylophaga nitratireducenticrescens TaxID=754476 RepID=I1XG44_METNJ|nr:hypothetical protein [Methylophaga nitratireducenticrescens]AFI83363.1 hypothetical protein Q7A_517 [Methylophaga nitratireducenticrescens]AUZ83480.1 hypothetical protein CDW43_02335 [Methylophaga nitratireducenticrescens]
MKNYSIALLICLGIPHFSNAQQSDMHVIADGRVPLESPDQGHWLTHPAVLQAANKARPYWQEQNSVYEEDFRIMASSQGDFTRPQSKQTAVLYLLSRWPRCCSNMGLAILEEDQLIRNIVFSGGTHHLYTVADINHDNLDELALISSFGMGGSNESSVSIVSLPADKAVLLGRMPLVLDNCAAIREDSKHTAFRISVNQHATDTFKLEEFQQDCEIPENEMTSSVKSIPIESNDVNDEYIDLPIT